MPSGFPKVDKNMYLKEDFYGVKATLEDRVLYLKNYILTVLKISKGTRVIWNPKNASTTTKFRCEKAKVLEFFDYSGRIAVGPTYSSYYKMFGYHKNRIVKPIFDFNPYRYEDCFSGIHFYLPSQKRKNAYLIDYIPSKAMKAAWDYIQELKK